MSANDQSASAHSDPTNDLPVEDLQTRDVDPQSADRIKGGITVSKRADSSSTLLFQDAPTPSESPAK